MGADFTGYNARSTNPETVVACFSFLGNGAAQIVETQAYNTDGILPRPLSGGSINRTGVGAFTLTLRDKFWGTLPFGGTNTVYQAMLGLNGTVLQAAGAAILYIVPQFASLDLQGTQQISFKIETGAAGGGNDASSSNLVCICLFLFNSSAG